MTIDKRIRHGVSQMLAVLVTGALGLTAGTAFAAEGPDAGSGARVSQAEDLGSRSSAVSKIPLRSMGVLGGTQFLTSEKNFTFTSSKPKVVRPYQTDAGTPGEFRWYLMAIGPGRGKVCAKAPRIKRSCAWIRVPKKITVSEIEASQPEGFLDLGQFGDFEAGTTDRPYTQIGMPVSLRATSSQPEAITVEESLIGEGVRLFTLNRGPTRGLASEICVTWRPNVTTCQTWIND